MTTVKERLERVQAEIAAACVRAGRPLDDVRLIAVSKKQPDPLIAEAIAAGQKIFGENYVQELERHVHAFSGPGIEWHLIGHLQSNKVKKAAAVASMIHTVDSVKLVEALDTAGTRHPGKLPCLVEVNVGGEAGKTGCAPEAAEPILQALAESLTLAPAGLMCIPPAGVPARPFFAGLRALRDQLAARTGLSLPELSMGMSADFPDAILEGATLVRVGTAIFGPRA